MQDRILNPIGIQESILVLNLRNQTITCWSCGGDKNCRKCQCHDSSEGTPCNLVCRGMDSHYFDAELILREKLKPAVLHPVSPVEGSEE